MAGFLRAFGFALPLSIVVDAEGADPTKPPRDSLPVAGRCVLCKRERAVTYKRGDNKLVCKLCLDDTLASKRVQRARASRGLLPDRPAENAESTWKGERHDWWEAQFT